MSLTLIIGPMYSGKTTKLIGNLSTQSILGKKCVLVSHLSDARNYYGDKCYTHNNIVKLNNIDHIKLDNLEEIPPDYDVIGIDEAQFFDCLDHIYVLLKEYKRIYISGLSGDSNRKIFGQLLSLIPECDDIVHLKALCKYCSDKNPLIDVMAPFTKRIVNKLPQKLIGGYESYIPTCRNCHNK